jgi:hypothetical protein
MIASAPGRGSVKCDSSSMMAGATRLIAKASGIALDGDVRFPSKISIVAGALSIAEAPHAKGLAR